MPRLFYLNGSFDLALAGRVPERFDPIFREMTLWYILAASRDDRVLVDVDVPPEYLAYLADCGLPVPAIVRADAPCAGFDGVPWGWDRIAAARIVACAATTRAPDLATVKRVNSRAFSSEVSALHGYGVPGSRLFFDVNHLLDYIRSVDIRPLVIKPNFGNSGIGFIRIVEKNDLVSKGSMIASLFVDGNPVVVEPWLERSADLSTRFELALDGSYSSVEHYPTFITSNGSFYGMQGGAALPQIDTHRDVLDRMVERAAPALHEAGYFGPVSIDSMVTGKPGQLVPMLEINARQGMSFIALSLRDRLAHNGRWLFRTVGRKQHALPERYSDWFELLSGKTWSPERGSGILCLTPLRLAGARPSRSLFFVVGRTEDEFKILDDALTSLLQSGRGSS